jgi:hypothetical protein
MEYSVLFTADNGDQTTKLFKLIPSSTMKARSILFQFFRNDDGKTDVDLSKIQQIMSKNDSFQQLMSTITVGEKDVNWFEADWEVCDRIISDFFSSFVVKT